MERVTREAKKEFRKRGSARRELDLNDLVLDLPPRPSPPSPLAETVLEPSDKEDDSSSNDDDGDISMDDFGTDKADDPINNLSQNPTPYLPPPESIRKSERNIIEKHKQIVQDRLKKRQLEKLEVLKHKKNTRKVSSKRIATVKSKSIRIKYRRIPSNKAKLIYTDVISQMIKDYIRNPNTFDKYMSNIASTVKNTRSRKGRKGKSGSKKTMQIESMAIAKQVLKEYYERVDEYFTSLIDLQLSNSLIKNDLDRINYEKNKLRLKIFELRKERSSVGLEIKQLRDEFQNLNIQFSSKNKLYKQLANLKSDEYPHENYNNVNNTQSEKILMDEISYKLNRLKTHSESKSAIKGSLKLINDLLNNA